MKSLIRNIIIILTCILVFPMIGCATGVAVEDYDKALAERDALYVSIDQAKADLSDANKTSADLAIQLNEIISSKANLQTQFDDYVKKSTEYNALIETEKQAAIDIASRKQEFEDIKAQSDVLQNSIISLTDEINVLTEQKSALEAEIYALENKIIEYKEMPVQLTNGNYTAGVDFPAGTYDIYAVAGRGTVSTDDPNSYRNSIYEMMGVAGSYYIKDFQNVLLSRGTVIKVSGVTIELREKAN